MGEKEMRMIIGMDTLYLLFHGSNGGSCPAR